MCILTDAGFNLTNYNGPSLESETIQQNVLDVLSWGKKFKLYRVSDRKENGKLGYYLNNILVKVASNDTSMILNVMKGPKRGGRPVNNVVYETHAKHQMFVRNISDNQINDALSLGLKIPGNRDRYVWLHNNFYIVGKEDDKANYEIISAVRISLIDKDGFFRGGEEKRGFLSILLNCADRFDLDDWGYQIVNETAGVVYNISDLSHLDLFQPNRGHSYSLTLSVLAPNHTDLYRKHKDLLANLGFEQYEVFGRALDEIDDQEKHIALLRFDMNIYDLTMHWGFYK
jgi:hypothetical protein